MRRALIPALLLVVAPSVVHAQSAETIEYYGQDVVGSIRIVFTPTGTVIGRQDYEPFGRPLFTVPAMPREGFGSQEADGETNQEYFHARMFQARTGRFSSVDPIFVGLFDPQQFNRYAYAANQPLNLIDPEGLQARGAGGAGPRADLCTEAIQQINANDYHCGAAGGSSGDSSWMDRVASFLDLIAGSVPVGGPESELRPTPRNHGTMSRGAQIALGVGVVAASLISPVARASVAQTVAAEEVAVVAGSKTATEAFHYTFSSAIKSIEQTGLRPESYATPNGALSPLGAQIELALDPTRGLTDAVLRIDLAGLRSAGYSIPSVSRVSSRFGMPGGGYEILFPYRVPGSFITVVPR